MKIPSCYPKWSKLTTHSVRSLGMLVPTPGQDALAKITLAAIVNRFANEGFASTLVTKGGPPGFVFRIRTVP